MLERLNYQLWLEDVFFEVHFQSGAYSELAAPQIRLEIKFRINGALTALEMVRGDITDFFPSLKTLDQEGNESGIAVSFRFIDTAKVAAGLATCHPNRRANGRNPAIMSAGNSHEI